MFGCEKLPLLATNLGKGGMPARVGYLLSWLVDVRLSGSILKHLTIVTYQHLDNSFFFEGQHWVLNIAKLTGSSVE